MKAPTLRRFVPRATRYVLRPQDHTILRFAHGEGAGGRTTQETTMSNISKTGLAFVVERDFAPLLGDLLKIEFTVPGGGHVAWWARVVRTEEHGKKSWWLKESGNFRDLILVGVEFQNLPEGHQREIQTGIDGRMAELMREHRAQQFKRMWLWFLYQGWKILGVLALGAAIAGILYWLCLPSANYDPKRGAPWGERFEFFK